MEGESRFEPRLDLLETIRRKAVLREAELVPGSAAAPEQHPADADAGDQHGAVFDRREVIEPVLEHTCELREPATESVYDGK